MNSELYDNASKFQDSYHTEPGKRIDKLWKQCFNKETKQNELKCVPIEELQEKANTVFPKYNALSSSIDFYTKTDLDDWKLKCNALKNKNLCEVNAPYPNGSQHETLILGGTNAIMCKELN